jgi:hypothetical protein
MGMTYNIYLPLTLTLSRKERERYKTLEYNNISIISVAFYSPLERGGAKQLQLFVCGVCCIRL